MELSNCTIVATRAVVQYNGYYINDDRCIATYIIILNKININIIPRYCDRKKIHVLRYTADIV